MALDHSRYRVEDGTPVVDVRLPSVDNLFDNRDPAPFRDRDLDPDLVEYLIDTGEDLAAQPGYRIVFWLEKACAPNEVPEAFHAHFEYELERLDRERRRARRTGELALAVAAVLIVGLLSIAELVGSVLQNRLGAGIKKGITISCWVLMWRPVEILVYDWIPYRRQRRVLQRLLRVPLEVRPSDGGAAPSRSSR